MPVGPTGCEGSPQGDGPRTQPWLVGASFGWFASELSFSEGLVEPAISQQLITASAGRQLGESWSVRVAAGAVAGGTLSHDGRNHDVGVGWVIGVTGARRWTFGARDRWFATGSATLGVSSTRTSEAGGGSVGLTATDLTLGAIGGITLWERVSPYALARYFGGPVFWQLDGEDITGTDQHHYQLGMGASVRLPRGLNALVDASLLGQRSVSIGVSIAL